MLVVDLGCHVHCLFFLGVWHLDRDNLHALRTWPNGITGIIWSAKPWNAGNTVRTPAAGLFKISRACLITVERGRWRVMKKRSHHASLRIQKIGIRYENVWLASFPWIQYSHPADLRNVVTGLISPEIVNAHDAMNIGNGQLALLKRAGLMDLLFYPSCYWPWQWRER